MPPNLRKIIEGREEYSSSVSAPHKEVGKYHKFREEENEESSRKTLVVYVRKANKICDNNPEKGKKKIANFEVKKKKKLNGSIMKKNTLV